MFGAKRKTNKQLHSVASPSTCAQTPPVHALRRICTRRWTPPHRTSSSPRRHPWSGEPTWASAARLGETEDAGWVNKLKTLKQSKQKTYTGMHFSWIKSSWVTEFGVEKFAASEDGAFESHPHLCLWQRHGWDEFVCLFVLSFGCDIKVVWLTSPSAALLSWS